MTLHVQAEKTALLLMDFQHVLLDNYLSAEQSAAVLGHAAELLAVARKAKMPVIHVMVAFRPGYPEVSPRNTLFSGAKEHGLFARGAATTAIHPVVAPEANEPVVIKHRIGAFSGTDLDTLLQARGIDRLVLAGITTSGVVLSTARQAFDRDYQLVVASDACADPDAETHRVLLDKVLAQHATLVKVQELAVVE